MGFYLTALEASTEGITAEEVSDTIEQMKKPGVVRTYLEGLVPDLLAFLFQVVIACVVYAIGVKLIKLFRKLVRKWLDKKDADKGVKQFMDALVKCIGYFFLIVIILSLFGIATTSVMAIAGSAGLTVGLALQGSLANFAGGVLILMLKPFKVGDYIQAAGFEGTVEQIGVFYTNLATIDNKLVMIPNGTLSNGSLINYSAKETRRVDLVFSVSYDSDLLKVRRVLKEIVDKHKLILQKPEPFIGLIHQNASSLDFTVRVWVKNSDYWTVYFDLLESVKNRFDEEDIDIPYPQMDLHLKNIKE